MLFTFGEDSFSIVYTYTQNRYKFCETKNITLIRVRHLAIQFFFSLREGFHGSISTSILILPYRFRKGEGIERSGSGSVSMEVSILP